MSRGFYLRFCVAVCLILLRWDSIVAAPVWFGDLREPAEITTEQAETMLRWCAGDESADLMSLNADRAPRIVFLSASDGQTRARVSIGAGRGWSEALLLARANLKSNAEDRWFKIDLVNHVTPLGTPRADQPVELEIGVEGLATAPGVALSPDVLAAAEGLDKDRIPIPSRLLEAWNTFHSSPLKAWPTDNEAFRFDTASYFFDGKTVARLYRGHRTFDALSDDQLDQSARAAGAYLARSVSESGRFVYEYRPRAAQPTPDRYNMLRHAGTVYAMMELYERSPDEALLAAARRAIGFLQTEAIKPWKVGGEDVLVVVDEGSEIKLGGNALAMIALIQYAKTTGDDQYLDTLRKLARWLVLTQKPSGKFGVQKQVYPTGEITDMESDYYPGQSIMALCRLHAVSPDDSYVETSAKAARYLIHVRYGQFTDAELFHDHWMIYGLNELCKFRSDPLFLAHVRRLSRVIMASQIRTPLWPDWRGGYYRPPRGNPTATRSEGLCAAYPMVLAEGDATFAAKIHDAVEQAVKFQLQLQFDEPSAMYFDDPQRVLGAFHDSLTDPDVRIDTVQHNISAILGLLRIRSQAPAP